MEASVCSSADATKLTALVQSSQVSEDCDLGAGAPDGAVYKGKAGNITDTLNGHLDKAESQLDDARKAEPAALRNFEMPKQSLLDSVRFSNQDLEGANQGLQASAGRHATALTVTLAKCSFSPWEICQTPNKTENLC